MLLGELLGEVLWDYMPKTSWFLYRIENSIWHLLLRMFGFSPWSKLLDFLTYFISSLVIVSPILVVWFLYKRIMIRLGKDPITNYKRYQKKFADHCTGMSSGITANISMHLQPLNFRGDLLRRILKLFIVIFAVIGLCCCILWPIINGFANVIYHLCAQIGHHYYTKKSFVKIIFRDIGKIVFPIIIPIAVYIIIVYLGNGANSLYKKKSLILKTKTRITTKICKAKKVHYDKSDI